MTLKNAIVSVKQDLSQYSSSFIQHYFVKLIPCSTLIHTLYHFGTIGWATGTVSDHKNPVGTILQKVTVSITQMYI